VLESTRLVLRCFNLSAGLLHLDVVRKEPHVATIEPVVRLDLERVDVLELLGMTLEHLYDAEARVEISPRVPLLMAIRDKLVSALREDG